jgi:hypothetical protein
MKILTAVVNNPLFIKIQYYTLQKYMKSIYEFIVFNDAKNFPDFSNGGDVTIKQQIENICKELNIKCINIPNLHHKNIRCAMQRCADSMNYMLKYQLSNPDKYLIIDSDMFLIDYFDNDYDNYESAIVLQYRENSKINYFWNGLYYFNIYSMKNLDKLDWNPLLDCDVGGMMKEWLSLQSINVPNTNDIRYLKNKFDEYDTDGIHYIKHLWSTTWDITECSDNLKNNTLLLDFLKTDPRNINGKFYAEIYDNKFLHYRAGGNWSFQNNSINGMKLHNLLSKKLEKNLLYDK